MKKGLYLFLIILLVFSGLSNLDAKRRARYFYPNFSDTDMKEFLKVMSDVIGKNIIISNKIRGKISIYSPKGIPVSRAFDILKAVLELYGYVAIDKRDYIKIVSKKDYVPPQVLDSSYKAYLPRNKIVIKALSLKYVSSRDIKSLVRSMGLRYIKVLDFPKSNTVILVGTADDLSSVVRLVLFLDKALPKKKVHIIEGEIHVYPLKHASAESLEKVIGKLNLTYKQIEELSNGKTTKRTQKVIVVAYKDTNSLIIKAPPEKYEKIESIIKSLDIPRKQVLIEATIIELTLQDTDLLGVDWRYGSAATQDGATIYGGASQSVGVIGNIMQNSTGDTYIDRFKNNLTPGLTLGVIKDEGEVFAILNAAAKKDKFKVLSNPQIITLDNNEAEINVGQDIPIVSNVRVTDQNTIIRTYQYKSVGIKLKITPHINPEDYVTLKLNIEIQSLFGANIAENPIITKRDVKTKLLLKNGKTVVIGGLIKEDISNRKSFWKLGPIDLSYIPVLGRFFRQDASSKEKTNIIIFIRPLIIKPVEGVKSQNEDH